MQNLLVLFIFYFVCSISIIGYGTLFLNLLSKKSKFYDIGYLGIFGLILTVLISYLSNLVVPHSHFFNSIYVVIGLISLYFFFKRNYRNKILYKNIKTFFIIFLLIFISLLISKNHDDFSYYHFVSTYNLTQFDSLIGTGQFLHGFRTPSSIFYINSLFYLPIIEFYSFNFATVFVLGFSNIILLNKINIYDLLKIDQFQKKIIRIDASTFFSFLSLIFINIFFYRLSEHGTDRSAQILIMVLFSEMLKLLDKKPMKLDLNFKILPLIVFIISLKSFYIFYLAFFIPVYFYYLQFYSLKELIFNNILKLYSVIFVLIFILMLGTYFFSSGCLIYPVEITCLENFSWSIPLSQVESMHLWYQQWSKAGAGPNFRIEDPAQYVQNFNWLNNWLEKYFFNKVSDFLLGLAFLIIVIVVTFSKISSRKKKLSFNKFQLFFFLTIFILLSEWFLNRPALRYGGYILIASILLIPLSLFLSSFEFEFKKLKVSVVSLLLITLLIFLGRNIHRINKENKIYNYNPFQNAFYEIKPKYLNEYKKISDLINNYENCKANLKCNNKMFNRVDKKFGKYIFKNQ